MYLNMGSECGIKNRIVEQVNGTHILLYGHVYERYCERIQMIGDKLNIAELDYDYMMKEAITAIKDNYDKCITKDGKPVWKVLYGSFNLQCDRKNFTIEITALLKSTRVGWKSGRLQMLAEDYEQYVADGILKEGDTVIAVETTVLTIKAADEAKRINFAEFEVVRTLNFNKKNVRTQPRELKQLFPEKLIYNTTLCTKDAKKMLKGIYRRNNL